MSRREKELEDILWEAMAHLENAADELDRKSKHLRDKAKEIHIVLDPPVVKSK